MASKYIKKFPIPECFPEILHDFTKEVLRNQPEDIYDFGREYFKCLQEGIVLDYERKGQNIPCDYKPVVPKIMKKEIKEIKESKESKRVIEEETIEKISKKTIEIKKIEEEKQVETVESVGKEETKIMLMAQDDNTLKRSIEDFVGNVLQNSEDFVKNQDGDVN